MEAPLKPDDARKLLGGYATGTLTPEEVRALFNAALEDQELFDELAREQDLKEILDDPRHRAELLSATETPKRSRWVWWALPGLSGVGLAAATIAVMISRSPAPVMNAKLGAPPPSLAAPGQTERRADQDRRSPDSSRLASRPNKAETTSKAAAIPGAEEKERELPRPEAPPPPPQRQMEPAPSQPSTTGAVGAGPGSPTAVSEQTAIQAAPVQTAQAPQPAPYVQQQFRAQTANALRDESAAAKQLFDAPASRPEPAFAMSRMKAKAASGGGSSRADKKADETVAGSLGLHHTTVNDAGQVSLRIESNAAGYIYLFRRDGNAWTAIGGARSVQPREPILSERLTPGSTIVILLSRSEITDLSTAAVERARTEVNPRRVISPNYAVDALAPAGDVVAATVTLPVP